MYRLRSAITGVVSRAREAGPLQQSLEIELGIKIEGRRVERRGGVLGVDMVGASNGVRCQQGNDFFGAKVAPVLHAREDLIDRVLRLWDESIRPGGSGILTASEEFQSRSPYKR